MNGLNSLDSIDKELDNFNSNQYNKSRVIIMVQQRSGTKQITSISGLADDLDLKKILRYLKKIFNCNGAIIDDSRFGKVITLTGNQKENVYKFFIKAQICTKEEMVVKGY